MTAYQPGIPTGTVNLSQDYINIKNNFTQLNNTYGVDHVAYSVSQNNGYHKAVHMIPVSTVTSNAPNNQPINGYTATPGFGQVFCAQINDGLDTDESFYFLTGGNKLIQMTRNIVPSIGVSGCTFLPGGLMVQWGTFTGAHAGFLNSGDNGFINFTTTFPSACYGVLTSLQFNGVNLPANSGTVGVLSPIATNRFGWYFVSAFNKYTNFSWVAIGS